MESELCPAVAPFFGYMGVAAATIFANIGAAIGTARAGVGIMFSGINSPDLVWRNLIPIVMAGVNGIYGLITSIVVLSAITSPTDYGVGRYSLHTGFAHLAAGLCCGLCGLGSGACIGIAGDAAIMGSGIYNVESKKSSFNSSSWKLGSSARKPKKSGGGENLFVAMVLVQVFAGNIALYGLITSIILSQQTYSCGDGA